MSASNFFHRLIGFSDEDFIDEDSGFEVIEPESHEESDYPQEFSSNEQYSNRSNSSVAAKKEQKDNVVGMRGLTHGNTEVMVIEPKAFEEMPKVINALRNRKSVVLNLDKMDPEEAQRAVDFVSGGTYAMDGHNERVGDSIFLFTPSCVTVSNLAGLISSADDLASARVRSQGTNRPVEEWQPPTAVAQ